MKAVTRFSTLLGVVWLLAVVSSLYFASQALISSAKTLNNQSYVSAQQFLASIQPADRELNERSQVLTQMMMVKITNDQGDVLVNRFAKANTGLNKWLEQNLSLAQPGTIADSRSNLVLEYQVDVSLLTENFIVMALSLVIAISFVAIIATVLLMQFQHKFMKGLQEGLQKLFADYFLKHSVNTAAVLQEYPNLSVIQNQLNQLGKHLREQADEIKLQAQQVKSEANTDRITGLENRNSFLDYFEHHVANQEKRQFGVFAITRCSELQSINQTQGYQHGDKYIQDSAEMLKKIAAGFMGAKVFRLNTSDFLTLLPNITMKEAERYADAIQARYNEYQQVSELSTVGHTGMVNYDSSRPLGELLALCDTAVSLAQTKQNNGWHAQKESMDLDGVSANFGAQNWRDVLDDILDNNRVNLLVQPISPTTRANKTYSEVLARFVAADGHVLPTSSVMAMATRLEKSIALDKLVIESLLTAMKTKSLGDQFFGINVTATSAHDETFVVWLERRLLKDQTLANKLIFEISEYGLQKNVAGSKRFIDMVHRVGARITVERFGVGLTSFKFFRDLKPDFIKMDVSYTRAIDEDKNNQYFLRLMVDVAHRIGVSVIAEGVETQEEKHTLERLLVDGVQGYFINKPQAV